MSTLRLLRMADLPLVAPRCCRWCGAPLPPRRTLWCGNAHRDLFALLSQGGLQRAAVFARDRGVCSACGLDTELLRQAWRQVCSQAVHDFSADYQALAKAVSRQRDASGRHYVGEAELRARYKQRKADEAARLAALGFKGAESGHFWEADHVVPVIEGGGVRHGMTADQLLANLRTLCLRCHRAATAALAARRATARRPQQVLGL